MHPITLPRVCLSFTNVLFFIISSAGFALCLWVSLRPETFLEVNYKITKSSIVRSTATFMNLKLWSTSVNSILVLTAMAGMLTTSCGLIGAGCKLKCPLKFYILLVTVVCSISFGIFFVSGIYYIYTGDNVTRLYYQRTLTEYYGNKDDMFTYLLNYIMRHYHCCGVEDYTDFNYSKWRLSNPGKLYPEQCCKFANETIDVPISKNCTKTSVLQEAYLNKGCLPMLREAIVHYKQELITYLSVLCGLYFLIVLFASCILKDVRKVPPEEKIVPRRVKGQTEAPKEVCSKSSLENMMLVEEAPKKLVKVVSAIYPHLTYKLSPSSGDIVLPKISNTATAGKL